MATDVKWVKLTTDMFDNRKIRYIRSLPEGNNIVLVWIMLLTLAGRCNRSGWIYLTDTVPYTPQMVAAELGFDVNIITLALNVFENLEMILPGENGDFAIKNWEEYQSSDRMDEIREQNRIRKQNQRSRQKLLMSRDSHVTVTSEVTGRHVVDTDKDIDREIDKEIDIDREIDRDIERDSDLNNINTLSEYRENSDSSSTTTRTGLSDSDIVTLGNFRLTVKDATELLQKLGKNRAFHYFARMNDFIEKHPEAELNIRDPYSMILRWAKEDRDKLDKVRQMREEKA